MKNESGTLPPIGGVRLKDYSSVYRKFEERSTKFVQCSIERM